MIGLPQSSPPTEPKKLAIELQSKLQQAYERGTSWEATNLLTEEFEQLRKTYNEQLKALRNQVGL